MDYCPGGDLKGVLVSSDCHSLSESVVCHTMAEAIMAVQALHDWGFIHRCLALAIGVWCGIV